jgi:peroxiredoxin
MMASAFKTADNEGYKVGDVVTDFTLKNIDGKMVSLANYKKAKGFIVVFTCNHCPFAKAYEDRIIALDKTVIAAKIRIRIEAPVCLTLSELGCYKKIKP